uniref:Small integral membrane protein 20 n=2 Tax=Sarcophilus harrisii TaxID=9305 RepID=A0A7N4V5I6_SARHA
YSFVSPRPSPRACRRQRWHPYHGTPQAGGLGEPTQARDLLQFPPPPPADFRRPSSALHSSRAPGRRDESPGQGEEEKGERGLPSCPRPQLLCPRSLLSAPCPGSESLSPPLLPAPRACGGRDLGFRGCDSCETPRAWVMTRNLRTAMIFGGFAVILGAVFYPIYFRPLMKTEEYKLEQSINRAGIVQADVQPPGLKVWSDPFGRK